MENDWYKLENMSKFFASNVYMNDPYVFRFSCTLKEDIDKTILEKALNEALEIYPNFKVNLKKGIFWYYLEKAVSTYPVYEESLPICSKIHSYNEDDLLIRTTYYKNRINLEVTHIISDGLGTLTFFKTLVYLYLKSKYELKNLEIEKPNIENDISYNQIEIPKVKKKTKISLPKIEKIYRYKGLKRKNPLFIEAHMSTKSLLNLAHKYNTTMTVFLISCLFYSIIKNQKPRDKYKTIRLSVPVDLRKYFNSTTTKNFFAMSYITYKENDSSNLENIIKKVEKSLTNELQETKLLKRVNSFKKLERNIILSSFPLVIKDIVLTLSNYITSYNTTTSFSNIGKISVDDRIKPYIKEFNVLTSTSSFQFTGCSYEDIFCLGISSIYKNNNIVKNYLRTLSSLGLEIKINTNEE